MILCAALFVFGYMLERKVSLPWYLQFLIYWGYYLFGYIVRKTSIPIRSSVWFIMSAVVMVAIIVASIVLIFQKNALAFLRPISPVIIVCSTLFFIAFSKLKCSHDYTFVAKKCNYIYFIHALFIDMSMNELVKINNARLPDPVNNYIFQ